MSRLAQRKFTLKSGATINALISSGESADFTENAIICLSGYGCDHYNFAWIEEALGAEFPMILLDNRGMGQSSPATGDYEIKDIARDAYEVAQLLKLKHFHVAGISMGGFVAQELTLMAGAHVKSLALMCTTSGGEEFYPLPPSTEDGLRAFYSLEEPLKTTSVLTATVHPSVPAENPELFQRIVNLRMAHPVNADQAIYQKRAVDRFLAEKLPLAEIQAPTLVMTGAQDRYVDPRNSEKLHTRIKNSTLIKIDQADHHFFLEKAEEVAGELKKFWREFGL